MDTSSPAASNLIRVLCVDDHSIVREGIAFVLDLQPDMKVVASAANADEAIAMYAEVRPDVTLMDLQMPGKGGVEAIRAIRRDFADARIIVLTVFDGDDDISRALEAGATAYVLKDTLSDELVRIVREVHNGEHPVGAEVAARLAFRGTHPALSPREHQVLELVANGMRNKEIADRLAISEETVHAHTKRLFTKLQVNDRTAAVTVALRRGMIRLS